MKEQHNIKFFNEQGDTNLSERRSEYQKTLSTEELNLINRDKKVFLHQSLSTPVLGSLKSTKGAYIITDSGSELLDLHGNGVHNAGFSNSYIIKAIKQQLEKELAFTPRRYTNEKAIEFAEKLIQISPDGLDRVLFCPGGSQAIELAVMLAKQVTGKWKTLSYYDSYHGNGYQAASIGGQPLFSSGNGSMVPGSVHIEYPDYYRNPWNWNNKEQIDNEYIRQLETAIKHHPEIAALIAEPVSANPTVPSKYYWQRVRELCDKNNILLIFDEIITGFGRTGKMFACEHFVTPDILVLGKSLGGGIVPFAGIVTKNKFNILADKSIGHFTHEKNPLCAAAGLAEIEYILNHNLINNASTIGSYLMDELKKLKVRFGIIGNIEGIGLHIGVELVTTPGSKEPAINEAEEIMYSCLQNGISLKIINKNIIAIRPSLVIGLQEAAKIISTLSKILSNLENKNL